MNTQVKDRKLLLKDLLKKFMIKNHSEDIANIKSEIKNMLGEVDPTLLAQAEQELVKEGYTRDNLMSVCDIHMELFTEELENHKIPVKDGHPLDRFHEDHVYILKLYRSMNELARKLRDYTDFDEAEEVIQKMRSLTPSLMEVENHSVRQENTLFPVLERHGIEEPPAIMWQEHVEMKQDKKIIVKTLEDYDQLDFPTFAQKLIGLTLNLVEKFNMHSRKEENILYPASLKLFTDEEWDDVLEECDRLGYFEMKELLQKA